MAALSNYLESGLLNFVFRGESFSVPSNISIALVSGIKEADPADADTGTTILEIPSGINGSGTGYNRVNLGEPSSTKFSYTQDDFEAGIAIVDAPYHNTDEDNAPGNVLMHAALDNPRIIYAGDNVKFDYNTLEISFK